MVGRPILTKVALSLDIMAGPSPLMYHAEVNIRYSRDDDAKVGGRGLLTGQRGEPGKGSSLISDSVKGTHH